MMDLEFPFPDHPIRKQNEYADDERQNLYGSWQLIICVPFTLHLETAVWRIQFRVHHLESF